MLVFAIATTAMLAALPVQADELLRGIYADRGTRAEFTPCRGKRPLVVVDGTSTQNLSNTLRPVTGAAESARAVFIEAMGTLDAKRVRITEVRHAYTEGLACREDPRRYVWKAFGNEPFWRLESDARGVRVQRTGEPEPISAPPGAFTEAEGKRRFSADTPRGAFEIALEPGACRDSMVDSLYAWRAELTLKLKGEAEPRVLRGCAYPGLLK